MTSGRRKLSAETIALFIMGAVFVGAGALLCATAYRSAQAHESPASPPLARGTSPALPPAQPATAVSRAGPSAFAPPRPASIFAPPRSDEATTAARETRLREEPTSPSIELGSLPPMPAPRPIELNSRLAAISTACVGTSREARVGLKPAIAWPIRPLHRRLRPQPPTPSICPTASGSKPIPGSGRCGTIPAHVDEKDRGATPPHLYDLTLREDLFHGVQALRLNPVGGASSIFDRVGLLAHTYMLGPNGDSNGCVSFKNYDAFLQAFQIGRDQAARGRFEPEIGRRDSREGSRLRRQTKAAIVTGRTSDRAHASNP